MSHKELAVLLACFSDPKAAAKAREPLAKRLRSGGDIVLQAVELRVNRRRKVELHDPRRVLAGTLTSALTWGLFGLLTGGWLSLVIWALLGGATAGPPSTTPCTI